MKKYKKGDYVKFDAPTGSIGRVESRNHYGGVYVRWAFGRDVEGEEITSGISSCEDSQLIAVPKATYIKARDGAPFKGDRQ